MVAGMRDATRRTGYTQFTHPVSGHRVVFIGMIHRGTEAYYGAVDDLVGRYRADGFQVHYEGVFPPGAHAEMTDAERDRVKRWRDVRRELNDQLVELVGGVKQPVWTGALSGEPGWHNHDMDTLEMARQFGVRHVEREIAAGQRSIEAFQTLTEHEDARRALGWVLRGALGLMSPLVRSGFRVPGSAIIVDLRDDLSVAAARDAAPDPVVMTWGAAHFPGVHDRLVEAGYEVTHHAMISVASGRVVR